MTTLAASAPPLPFGAPWGGGGAVALVAADPARRWLATCEARRDTDTDGTLRVNVGPQGELRGDSLEAFLVDGTGEGRAIDAFAGADPSGRFVAAVKDRVLFLEDMTTREVISLDADLRDDVRPFSSARVAQFDPRGRRMLYPALASGRAAVVVRDLSTGGELRIDAGAGVLVRADFDASGDWIVLRVVETDTNGNGRLDVPLRSNVSPRCPTPVPRYPVPRPGPDEIVVRAARTSDGAIVTSAGVVVPLGAAVVVRDADGALAAQDAAGKRVPLAPAKCESRVLHVDPARDVLAVTCLKKNDRSDVRLVGGAGTSTSLGIELSAVAGDRWLPGSPRLIALYPGPDTLLVDLERRRTELLRQGDRVVATEGLNAAVLRGRSLWLHEMGAGELRLGDDVQPFERVLRAGPVLAVPPHVVDLARGARLGGIPAAPLAVARDGAVLVARVAADATRLATGPLTWVAPEGPRVDTEPVDPAATSDGGAGAPAAAERP